VKKFKVTWTEDTIENWESTIEANDLEEAQTIVNEDNHLDGANMTESTATERHSADIEEVK